MANLTDRLGLPLMAAGQAQKELTHNEALSLLDIAVGRCAESASLGSPPISPVAGQCWIVSDDATGAWEGRDRSLAGWTDNGWRYLSPFVGLSCWVKDRGNTMRFETGGWTENAVRADGIYVSGVRVVGMQRAGISDPAGGIVQDSEARTAISAVLATLRGHGLIEA